MRRSTVIGIASDLVFLASVGASAAALHQQRAGFPAALALAVLVVHGSNLVWGWWGGLVLWPVWRSVGQQLLNEAINFALLAVATMLGLAGWRWASSGAFVILLAAVLIHLSALRAIDEGKWGLDEFFETGGRPATEKRRRRLAAMGRDERLDLARGLLHRGRRHEAEAVLREHLRLEPDDAEARAMLDQIGTRRG